MGFTLPDRILKVPDKFNPYNRAHENRVGTAHASVRPMRKAFFKAVIGNFIILQVLFFALFCYMFGAIYTSNEHTHNIKILYMDYDGGVIGRSVRSAFSNLQKETFPTLVEMPPRGSTPDVAYFREQVCNIHYWAVLWTQPGASNRLAAALGGGTSASTYNSSDVMTFLWNEARYPTTADSSVYSSLNTLSSAARVAYAKINGTGAIQSMNTTDPAAVQAYSNPWQLAEIDIKPTKQGSRTIYNTLCVVLLIIQEFFYLAALNGVYAGFKAYEKIHPHRLITFRTAISAAFCFVGSVSVTGAIWIFKDGWAVGAGQFALTWMVLWLFMHVNFLWFDVLTGWVDMKFVPFFMIMWVVANVASLLLPYELMPGFYRWSWAMPAHAVYVTEMDIWSGGCVPQLQITLPILFAWEVLGLILSAVAIHRRCHYAVLGQEAQTKQFQDKLNEAMAFERKRDTEHSTETSKEEKERAAAGSVDQNDVDLEKAKEDLRERTEMEAELKKVDTKERKALARILSKSHYGPSFDNPIRLDYEE